MESQERMRREAIAHARDRAQREGRTMLVTRQHRSDLDGGPIWYVRAAHEPASGGALMDTITGEGIHHEHVKWSWPYTVADIAAIETLDEYRAALARADWTYSYSDDSRAYNEGRTTMTMLFDLAHAKKGAWLAAWEEAKAKHAP